MNKSKLKLTVVIVTFLALAAVIVWEHWRAKQWMADANVLREQAGQAIALQEENRRLTEQLQATLERSGAEANELLRLRGQSGRLRQMEQENIRLRAEHERLAKAAQSSAPEPQESETPELKLQRAKGFFARDLGMALVLAADANHGILPAELRGPLIEMVERLSVGAEYELRAKQFELVYTGSLRDVKDVNATILAREKEPVQRADGQRVRHYVFADGHSQYISATTPEAFAAREQELWPGQPKQ